MLKKVALREHCAERAKERFGVDICNKHFEQIIAAARGNRARAARKISKKKTLWWVVLRGVWMPLIFDHRGGIPTTILQNDWVFDGTQNWDSE